MTGRKPLNDALKIATRWLSIVVVLMTLSSLGCTSLWRSGGDEVDNEGRLRDLMKVPDPPDLIRKAAIPRGMRPIAVEGVGVVNGLPGTGGPADPSSFRDQLLEEMKHNDVANPNQFLELDETALVRVRALIRPGARRGDPLDLLVSSPPRSRVSDLHGGWLLDTRMRHQQVLKSTIRKSDVMAMGTGPLLTRSDYEAGEDATLKQEAMILAGGRVQSDRNLGLILRPEFQHVKMASDIAAAINNRFFFFDGSTRRGIAKAVEDDYVEVEVHPRYRGNEYRMMSVILALGLESASVDSQQRLTDLAQRLGEPETASDAALQLEAIGENAVPTLIDALNSTNPEIRFYAAETLAYLDRTEAIEPLEAAARSVPAFRHSSLLALQGIPQQLAIDALSRLFAEPSLETRYGAFASIRGRDDGRRVLNGQMIGQSFRMYQVPSTAEAAVVVSLRESPEVVIFGTPAPIKIQKFLFGPNGLILKPDPTQPNQVRISRFQAGQDDRRMMVDNSLPNIIKGIVAVGGGYGDVMQVLRLAKDKGFMTDQLAIDPLPKPLRTYYRDGQEEQELARGPNDDKPPAEEVVAQSGDDSS
ncbi:MAG: flagellar biosynthesis protein FlgI, partial [Pirellulaceae bacterium]|nr:flagellar biosynthesis protein FlgI [Pirellulaceae bacterium]